MLPPAGSTPVILLRGLAGAAVGAVLGYFAFGWILSQGLYAIALPGALVGVGCGLATGRNSRAAGVLAGLIGLGLGLFLEWRYFAFVKDASLAFFLSHLHHLSPISLIMIGLGGVFGYWFGQGRPSTRADVRSAPTAAGNDRAG